MNKILEVNVQLKLYADMILPILDILVFQAHTIGMHRDRDEIVEAVKKVLGKKIKAMVIRKIPEPMILCPNVTHFFICITNQSLPLVDNDH